MWLRYATDIGDVIPHVVPCDLVKGGDHDQEWELVKFSTVMAGTRII